MITLIAGFFLVASLPPLIFRVYKGPSWSDRLLATDLIGIYLAAGLILLRDQTGWPWDRDVVWVVLVLGLLTVLGAGLLLEDSREP